MVNLADALNKIRRKKILVAGDLMLDTYTIGKAKRISPEAPVAIVQVHKEERRPGGAGNVALNLLSMGAEVSILGRIGQDEAGKILLESLVLEGVNGEGIILDPHYVTPTKNRIIADQQQIVRIDNEAIIPLREQQEQKLIEKLPGLLENVSVVAISDYAKGFLTRTLIAALIEGAQARKIPVISDPKGTDFTRYAGTTVLKPNLAEAFAAVGAEPHHPLDIVSKKILEMSEAEALMITRSEKGISLFYPNGEQEDFPVKVREVKDVTGAGDTVLAVLACGLANGLTLSEAVELSNYAAGIAIERFGCARITLSDLAKRVLNRNHSKVLDLEHHSFLSQAMQNREYSLLALSGEKGLTSTIYNTIRRLANSPERDLVVYLLDDEPSYDFVEIMASIQEVDIVLINRESLKFLYESNLPSEVVLIDEHSVQKLPEAEEIIDLLLAK